ncbi:FUSC family protein [Lichenifustis flavocetrariae]|uniref:FUSC family protein n=1 Tax=Lichenifustis flavocetrariae TaxID=2949735 RepID=A0AA41YVZ0_9HYPH|nr:FUSC family protein [Lichenifustis flavocetrariae]MCW6508152.1 FUSC family protein [Lichenifustis flavocetrariae]
MTVPSGRDWLFSVKTFAAAMLAVYIGLLTSLPRPYWAMATVYICSQPLSGATRSKGVYRVIGTCMGATAAIVLVPSLANAPVLLVGALALWVAGCLYVSLLDRSPRSYTFMLGGYTAALIGFPAATDPGSIWDLALARSEEITLGILCASLVSSLVFPRSVGDVVAARANTWLGDGARLALDALTGRGGTETRRDLIRLAGDAAEIDMLATHLAYDTSRIRDAAHHVLALRLRMLMLLPVLSSIADRLTVLRAQGDDLPPKLAQAIERLRGWIRPGPPSFAEEERIAGEADAEHLRVAIAEAEPMLDQHSDWTAAVTASLTLRLREFVDLASDCRALRHSIATGRRRPAPLRVEPQAGALALRHRDHAMALLSAVGVAIAIVLCCTFWIQSGWPDGSAAPMMAAVACCFFAAQDDPVPAILQFANYTGVAVVLMAVYQFAIFPLVHDFEILVLVLAPMFLIVGTLISMPKTAGRGLAIAANGSTVLALQSTYGADFNSYANSNLSLILGMYAAAIVTRLVRSVGAEWAIRRLIWSGRRTIAAAADRRDPANRARFAGLMLDRLGLLAPRLAALDTNHALRDRDILAHIRIGLNVIDLRGARSALTLPAQEAVKALLKSLARVYRTGLEVSDAGLIGRLDAALGQVLSCDEAPAKRTALLALVGIRRGLFPEAPPYSPDQPSNPGQIESAAA